MTRLRCGWFRRGSGPLWVLCYLASLELSGREDMLLGSTNVSHYVSGVQKATNSEEKVQSQLLKFINTKYAEDRSVG